MNIITILRKVIALTALDYQLNVAKERILLFTSEVVFTNPVSFVSNHLFYTKSVSDKAFDCRLGLYIHVCGRQTFVKLNYTRRNFLFSLPLWPVLYVPGDWISRRSKLSGYFAHIDYVVWWREEKKQLNLNDFISFLKYQSRLQSTEIKIASL